MQNIRDDHQASRTTQVQTQLLFSNSRVVVFGQLVIALMMVAFLWGDVNSDILLKWLSLSLILIVARVYLNYRFNHQYSARSDIAWSRLYTLISLFSGLVWGMLGLLGLYYAELQHFYLVVLVLCGVTTSAMMSNAVYLPASLLFIPAVVAPFIIFSVLHEDDRYHAIGWFALAYTLFVLVFLKKTNETLMETIRLRFKNEGLVKELMHEKDVAYKATELAERENIAKSKFLAAASHDLRQPLHALGLFFDALKLSPTLTERESLFPNIDYSVKSLGELLDALLDISKLDANAIEYRLRPTAMGDVIRQIVQEFEPEAGKKGICLRARQSSYVVETDPLWLERILRNLLSNAIRYTEAGDILVACRKRGTQLVLQVFDTGIGIDADELDNIFVEFQQLNNPQRDRNQGLGLGLAIVNRLCKLLGHTINVKSMPGKGSVFSLSMQISSEKVVEMSNSVQKITDNLNNKMVLVIDDEEQVNQAMSILLNKWGCEVISANSQQDAMDKIKQANIQPDIIVSDYRLAENRTGVEAIHAINASQGRSIPALLITGETAPEQINVIKESGYKVLHKPVKPARLRVMLNSMCK